MIDIPSFSSQPISNQTGPEDNEAGFKANESFQVQLEIKLPGQVKTYQLRANQGATAFKLLNDSYEVNYKQYEQGYFVTAINGVKQNQTHSWLYFVNEQPPSQAINEYKLSEGDKVSFRYLSQKESQKYFQ